MDFSIMFAFLQAVLGVVSNNSLSQGKKDTALAYLGLAGAVVQAGTKVNEGLLVLTTRVQTGDPISEDEWISLRTRSDVAHTTIQSNDVPHVT